DGCLRDARTDPSVACVGVGVVSPPQNSLQVKASFVLHRAGVTASSSHVALGRVSGSVAELFAMRGGVLKACALEGISTINLFCRSIATARLLVDPSPHTGQAHSLAACAAL